MKTQPVQLLCFLASVRKKKGSQIAWNFVQVRFHFLQFVTTSRLLFPAIQTIFSFSNCDKLFLFSPANEVRHVESIESSFSTIDDHVLIEQSSFDVFLSLKNWRTGDAKQFGKNLSFGPRQFAFYVMQCSFFVSWVPLAINESQSANKNLLG